VTWHIEIVDGERRAYPEDVDGYIALTDEGLDIHELPIVLGFIPWEVIDELRQQTRAEPGRQVP
jgi:hypothetical protein